MNTNTQARKFTSEQIQQASNLDLLPHFQGRLSVFGISIDDVTTVDRDDGIWLIDLKNGSFELQVSITDVSAIVPKDSPIDKEAMARVVTLYHTSPVTPMLPYNISTNLGSLEEGQKRLALTVFFQIDNEGKINAFRIKETIFSSIRAFNYDEVEKILANPSNSSDDQLLVKLRQIAQLLARGRSGKSGILTEDGYIDEDGNLIKENVNTHQLIAELMILTNTTIANFLAEKNINALYRTQDVGIEDLQLALKEMGHCLVPATYASKPMPHVGLGLMAYCHFTSPLRRFVDLVNHRIIKALIHQQTIPYSQVELDEIAIAINNFQQQYKLDRANYLKFKRQKDVATKFNKIKREDVANLSDEDFSDLIEYYAYNHRGKIKSLIPEIKKRINRLQPKDFYYIWFIGKVKQFFEYEEINAVSILLIKCQLDNSVVDYRIEYSDSHKLHFVYCYLDNLTTLNPVSDSKKAKAKNKSALATIKAFLFRELTDNPNPTPAVDVIYIVETKSTGNIEGNIQDNKRENQKISLKNLDIENLSEKEFSKVLDYAVKTKIEPDFLVEVEKRINRLQPKDLYKLWLEAKINCFFEYQHFNAVSVLVIHSQLTGAKIEYQIDSHFETESFIASCYVDGLTSPNIEIDSKKAKVKQKAALAYIQSYVNGTLTANPQPLDLEKSQEMIEDLDDIQPNIEIEIEIEDNSLNIEDDNNLKTKTADFESETERIPQNDTDWVSILNKLCQVKQINFPEYNFTNIDGFFSCIISTNYNQNLIKSQGYGKSKKEAKQNASKVLIIQHKLLLD